MTPTLLLILFLVLLAALAVGGVLLMAKDGYQDGESLNCREPEGSEQNPQPRLASEDVGRQVPGNVGAAVESSQPATRLTSAEHNAFPKGRWT